MFFASGLMLVPDEQTKCAQVGNGVVVNVGAGVVVTVVTGAKQHVLAVQPPAAQTSIPGCGRSVMGDAQWKPEHVGTGVVVTVVTGAKQHVLEVQPPAAQTSIPGCGRSVMGGA